ncbi:MAG: ABC transporter substrate-binding protein [Betaproteobacteria bacterium]|nr:ABC transporter substrate-binding protein [Betaproteobacteria bacterium]
MVQKRMKTFLGLLAFLLAFPAAAQALGPEELVRKVTADVLETVRSDKTLLADRKRALALVEEKVLPLLDFREATQLAVGKAWWGATPAQRDQLLTEFRGLLIRIYSNAIDTYLGQTIQVLPVRVAPGATETTVRNRYLKPGAPPVLVEYAMRKTADGWKIYDISVEGVSLVLTYRAEFEQVTRASGIEGLIKRLVEKNA